METQKLNTNVNKFSYYCLSNIEKLITGLPTTSENMLVNFKYNFIHPCTRITTLMHIFYNSETNVNKPFRYLPDFLPFNPYPTAFPYGNGMVLHFYQQQESNTTKTVHKVINKGLKTYV